MIVMLNDINEAAFSDVFGDDAWTRTSTGESTCNGMGSNENDNLYRYTHNDYYNTPQTTSRSKKWVLQRKKCHKFRFDIFIQDIQLYTKSLNQKYSEDIEDNSHGLMRTKLA
jgi:hypothetical protein